MTKVRCSMCVSPNGYISRLNGEEDWLSEENWAEFVEDAKNCNNIVIGRETYENVMQLYKDYNFDNVDCAYKIIVTKNTKFKAPDGYAVVNSPQEAIQLLESNGIKEILLAGGGKLNASFAEAGLIDELEIILEPHVIGNGRQMLEVGDYEFSLELKETEKLSGGRVRILYKVKTDKML